MTSSQRIIVVTMSWNIYYFATFKSSVFHKTMQIYGKIFGRFTKLKWSKHNRNVIGGNISKTNIFKYYCWLVVCFGTDLYSLFKNLYILPELLRWIFLSKSSCYIRPTGRLIEIGICWYLIQFIRNKKSSGETRKTRKFFVYLLRPWPSQNKLKKNYGCIKEERIECRKGCERWSRRT